MIATVIAFSVTFAAGTTGMLAFLLLLRDMVYGGTPANRPKPRLCFAPKPPDTNRLDRAFHRLVDESGAPLDQSAALTLIIGGAIVGAAAPWLLLENMLAAAAGLLAGSTLPVLWLRFMGWRRRAKMRKELPDALQIVADAVRAGHNLEEACELVARETKGPLGAEFAQAHSQFQLGHSPLSIMERLVRRVPLPEFRVFATAVIVHRRAGGNLPLLTERMSRSARERQQVRGHMLAVTAGSRLSAIGMVVGAMIAVAVLAGLEPDYVGKFFQHEMGPTLLLIAASLQLIGMIWVWRIVRVNY